jgi:tRNA(adenine34) deaminase
MNPAATEPADPAPEPQDAAPDAAAEARTHYGMRLALDQAHNALLVGEVPVGAVIMREGQLIATGYNRPITTHDPTAHAEIVALRHAAALLENYRLPGCEIYVTLEPCAMCAMALMHARFSRVVFGAVDPKTGAAGSVVNLFQQPQLNHRTELLGGVMADASTKLLREFFAQRRAQQKAARDAGRAGQGAALLAPAGAMGFASGVVEFSIANEENSIPTGDATELKNFPEDR